MSYQDQQPFTPAKNVSELLNNDLNLDFGKDFKVEVDVRQGLRTEERKP